MVDITTKMIIEVAFWVSLHTGMPITPPEVKQLPPFAMAQVVPECKEALRRVAAKHGVLLQGLCPAAAVYDRDAGVLYIASWLTEEETRSWLAHELVHRGHHIIGMPDPLLNCEDRREQESEAYAVQAEYNREHGIKWKHEAPVIKCQT